MYVQDPENITQVRLANPTDSENTLAGVVNNSALNAHALRQNIADPENVQQPTELQMLKTENPRFTGGLFSNILRKHNKALEDAEFKRRWDEALANQKMPELPAWVGQNAPTPQVSQLPVAPQAAPITPARVNLLNQQRMLNSAPDQYSGQTELGKALRAAAPTGGE